MISHLARCSLVLLGLVVGAVAYADDAPAPTATGTGLAGGVGAAVGGLASLVATYATARSRADELARKLDEHAVETRKALTMLAADSTASKVSIARVEEQVRSVGRDVGHMRRRVDGHDEALARREETAG